MPLKVVCSGWNRGNRWTPSWLAIPTWPSQLRPLLETAVCARSARVESLPMTVLARQRARGLALAADLRQAKNRHPLRRDFLAPGHDGPFGDCPPGHEQQRSPDRLGSLHPRRHPLSLEAFGRIDPIAPGLRPGSKKQALEHTFEERRVEETRSLITDERVEEVEFTGVVSSQSESVWEVSGIKVVITPHTQIDAGIHVGDRVDVDGSTNPSGGLDATHISLVNSHDDDDTNLPQMTPTIPSGAAPSGESSLQETPTESSIGSAGSAGEANHESEGGDQSSSNSNGEHSSDEHSSGDSNHDSHPDSEGGRD